MRHTPDIVRRNWNTLIEGVARRKDPNVTKWYGVILSAYAEDHRRYHTLDHIAFMLEHFERHRDQFSDEKQVLAAIFFHDIVYQTFTTDEGGQRVPLPPAHNEKKSARIARMALSEMGFDRAFCKRVADLINATASHHLDDDKDFDKALFLDIDMVILGSSQDEYKQYSKNVRAEYAAFDDHLFYKGRMLGFIQPTLENPPIFKTKLYQDLYEVQAGRNLLAEQSRITTWLYQNGHKAALAPKPKSYNDQK